MGSNNKRLKLPPGFRRVSWSLCLLRVLDPRSSFKKRGGGGRCFATLVDSVKWVVRQSLGRQRECQLFLRGGKKNGNIFSWYVISLAMALLQ